MSKQLTTTLGFALAMLLLFSTQASAMYTTYQAKIIKPDGIPLEATSVNFRFTILDPLGACILYTENFNTINMAGSGGLVNFSLGSGIKTFPVSGSVNFSDVFDNHGAALSCATGGPPSYIPAANDLRKIVMQFHDGAGWQTLPAMNINHVPYAMYAKNAASATTAINSAQLNGKTDLDFVQVSAIPACAVSQALQFNGASFGCVSVSGGGGGSITVSGTAPIIVTGTVSSPQISISVASMSSDGYLTAADYAEFKAKLSASGTEITNTLGFAPVSAAAVATQITAQISAAAAVSNTANALVLRDSSGNIWANDIYSNTAKTNYVDLFKPSTAFSIRLQAPTSLSASYNLIFPSDDGLNGQVLTTDGSGNLSWVSQTQTITSSDVVTALGYTPAASGSFTSSQWNTSGTTINYMAGNVGIGTSTPGARLQVVGSSTNDSYILVNNNSGGAYQGYFGVQDTSGGGNAAGVFVGSSSNHPFSIRTNEADRLIIDTSGNVSINPNKTIFAQSTVGTEAGEIELYNSTTHNMNFRKITSGNFVFSGGNVGIGGSSPNSTLDIQGSISKKITTISADTTLGSDDHIILVDSSSGTVTMTLPSAVGLLGREYYIQKIDTSSNLVNILSQSGQLIGATDNKNLNREGEHFTVISNGSGWNVLNGKGLSYAATPGSSTAVDLSAASSTAYTWIPGSTSGATAVFSNLGFGPLITFSGDANSGAVGYYQVSQVLSGDKEIRVSAYFNDTSSECNDPFVIIMPDGNTPSFMWNASAGQMEYGFDCSDPGIYGTANDAFDYSYSYSGGWKTLQIIYLPSLNTSRLRIYDGRNTTSGTPLSEVIMNEAPWNLWKINLTADQDNSANGETQFADLVITDCSNPELCLNGSSVSAAEVIEQIGFMPLSSTGGTMTGTLNLPSGGLNVGSGQFVVNINGNVGIGTTLPSTLLDVNGAITATSLRAGSGSGGPTMTVGTSAASPGYSFIGQTNTGLFNTGGSSMIGFSTTGTERMRIDSTGNIGIGTTSPRATLDINGTVLMKPAVVDTTSPIDFLTGNLQYTTGNCGAFALHNMKDGGSYTFAVKGTTSTTCSFTAYSDAGSTALTLHMPTDHGATTASKHTLYTFLVMGTDLYVTWMPGM